MWLWIRNSRQWERKKEDNLDSFHQTSCKKISGVAKNEKDLKSPLVHYPDVDKVLSPINCERWGRGTFHSHQILPKTAQSLSEKHAFVHKFKAREHHIEMYPLNRMYVHESAHLSPRKISILYSSISSAEVLNLGSMDAQKVLG